MLSRILIFTAAFLPTILFGQSGCPMPLKAGEAYVLTVEIGDMVLKNRCPCNTRYREECYLYELKVVEVNYLPDFSIYDDEAIRTVKYICSNDYTLSKRGSTSVIYCMPFFSKECLYFTGYCFVNPDEVEFFHPITHFGASLTDCSGNKKDPFERYINKVKKKEEK